MFSDPVRNHPLFLLTGNNPPYFFSPNSKEISYVHSSRLCHSSNPPVLNAFPLRLCSAVKPEMHFQAALSIQKGELFSFFRDSLWLPPHHTSKSLRETFPTSLGQTSSVTAQTPFFLTPPQKKTGPCTCFPLLGRGQVVPFSPTPTSFPSKMRARFRPPTSPQSKAFHPPLSRGRFPVLIIRIYSSQAREVSIIRGSFATPLPFQSTRRRIPS